MEGVVEGELSVLHVSSRFCEWLLNLREITEDRVIYHDEMKHRAYLLS